MCFQIVFCCKLFPTVRANIRLLLFMLSLVQIQMTKKSEASPARFTNVWCYTRSVDFSMMVQQSWLCVACVTSSALVQFFCSADGESIRMTSQIVSCIKDMDMSLWLYATWNNVFSWGQLWKTSRTWCTLRCNLWGWQIWQFHIPLFQKLSQH